VNFGTRVQDATLFVERINFLLKSQHKLQFILSKYWTFWCNQQNHGIWWKLRQTAKKAVISWFSIVPICLDVHTCVFYCEVENSWSRSREPEFTSPVERINRSHLPSSNWPNYTRRRTCDHVLATEKWRFYCQRNQIWHSSVSTEPDSFQQIPSLRWLV